MIKTKSPLLIIIALLITSFIGGAYYWFANRTTAQQSLGISEKPQGGDFIVRTKGKTLSLKDLRGKVVMLYMGYTQCPDICPTSLALMSQALKKMRKEELAQVNGLFISVDPERDTVEKIDNYTKYFHANIIGATADKVEIDRIAKLYGAAYRIVKSDSAMGYIVDHSSYTYIIDKNGKFRYSLVHGTAPDKILSTVRELLSE